MEKSCYSWAIHILSPRVTFTETWDEMNVLWQNKKEGKMVWLVGAQPFSCCLFRPCPSRWWWLSTAARTTMRRPLFSGTMLLQSLWVGSLGRRVSGSWCWCHESLSCITSQKSIGKMLFSLLGGRIEWMWKMERAWAWSQAKVSIQALSLPHSVTVGNSLYLPERKCPWRVYNTGLIMLHSVRKSQLENIKNSSHIVNTQ